MAFFGKRMAGDDVNPGREDKRQRTEEFWCPTEEPHPCSTGPDTKKTKHYAVWGPTNPGVHKTTWDTASKWINGIPDVKHKSFAAGKSVEAWDWYVETKDKYPNSGPKSVDSSSGSEPELDVDDGSDVDGWAFAAELQSDELIDDIAPDPEPTLCKEQADVVAKIMEGRRNVFYTGSAGVGKSTILKTFRRQLAAKKKHVSVVAPTGIAALDINGQTTYQYAGWTPETHRLTLDQLRKIAHERKVWKRLNETDVLVIDEISMVESSFFERLNVLMKEARNNDKPFGGVQLVITGDFCQLPPVKPFEHCVECGTDLVKSYGDTKYVCPKNQSHGPYYNRDKWAFQSRIWEECNFIYFNLTQIHRQSDATFINILQKLRVGEKLLSKEMKILLDHESNTEGGIEIYPTKSKVKDVNQKAFDKLEDTARKYKCEDNFDQRPQHADLNSLSNKGFGGTLAALKDHRYEPLVELKTGMRVVLLANLNMSAGLVNGSQGEIVGFEPYGENRAPRSPSGAHAGYRQEQIEQFMRKSREREWPVVEFTNGRRCAIYAECSVSTPGDEQPFSLLSRTQIPLMAGWAVTIHKSQGMTLSKVKVDLEKNFEQGMGYVALSRAKTLEGLKVVSFPRSAQLEANEEVKKFLRTKLNIMC